VILLDTSGLLAAIDAGQRRHQAARDALLSAARPLILSPFILAELDYLVASRVGVAAQRGLLAAVAEGSYELAEFGRHDVAQATGVIAQYAEHQISLADASIVVLADRLGILDVLTLDERHFRTLRTTRGYAFRLLPDDRT
jgi:uncharacterized protein